MPFVLPFDDDSGGITDLSHMNHKPAGVLGPVTVNDQGHFVAGGERIRFWGVNITANSSFPSHDNAEKVAARLAKFGVNVVRFHHMDFGWSGMNVPSLIDYPQGNSRNLHPGNLDRLDYFIYQLRKNGIYVNLNLLNSRYFYPSDGLPADVSQLDWKESHVLGFVNADFRDLEKEYARQLLSHTNPYTGLSYLEDPAIVMVEINNENSLFQQYYDGVVDQWPTVFRDELVTHWNTWLTARYSSTGEMEEAWGAIDEAPGAEMLSDGNFADGASGWNVEQHGGAQVTTQAGEFNGRQGLRWQVVQAGTDNWHAQLNQGGLSFVEGQLYTLQFSARADSPVTMNAALQQHYDPWEVFDSRPFALNSSWQDFEMQIVAPVSDSNLRINFNGFGNQQVSVYLADVSLRAGGSLGQLPAGESLEAGNVGGNLRTAGYPLGRSLDWAAFLRDLEYDYWGDMYHYVKDDLGYQGLVAGTTIMNSPPSAQALFDFADGHAYWQHPAFPGEPWDPVNWRVNNQSMVNTLANTVRNLSRERLHGLPFTVSEYQHSSPNTYSSEGPILIGAYAALQDWDGIMMFAYDASGNDNWGVGYVDNFFSMTAHPTKMANMQIGAYLFRRGDVSVAEEVVLMNFDEQVELNILATQGSGWNVANASHLGVPNDLPLRHRLALDLTGESGLDTPPAARSGPVHEADTGELRWDLSQSGAGVVTVNTPRSKAVVGFADGRAQQLGNVRIAVADSIQGWATVALSASEGSFDQPEQSAHLLLVTTGLMENTNMQWTSEARDSVGNQWGTSPTLVEVIAATIDLPFAAERTRVWALDETGQRAGELPVVSEGAGSRLQLTGDGGSLWYEIAVE